MPEAELHNLGRIGLLDKVPFSAALLQKMLNSARSRLQDARRTDNSPETRFDCAYSTIRAVADAALLAQGWRTSTSKPGHHQTTIGCLVHTLGVSPVTVRVLDALRKQRKLSDYDGELVTEQALNECMHQAESLCHLADQQLLPLLSKITPVLKSNN